MSNFDPDLFGEALKATMDRQPGPLTSRGSALPVTPASASPAAAGASPPMSMLERLGRTLEGAGYGMKGQTPPYMMEEQQRAEQGLRKQQLGLQERGVAVQEQQLQQQMQQFIVNKQMAVGQLFTGFFEKIASAKPEARAMVMEMGREFFVPLMQQMGFTLPSNLLKTMATVPGAATRFAGLVGDMMGNDPDAIKAVSAEIANLEDKDIPGYLKNRLDMATSAAMPQVQQAITEWARAFRGNPRLMSRHGLLDQQGKALPIPGELVMKQIPDLFKTNAQKAAAYKVLSDKDFAGYLANIGITPGTVSEKQAEVFGISAAKAATPEGQAGLAKTKAETALAQAQLGQIPAKTAQIEAQTAQTKQETKTGKVVPFQQGGGIATVKPEGITIQQTPGAKTEQVSSIRRDFEKQSQTFVTVRDFYHRLVASAKDPSAAGDLSVIFSYMKILDPTSVVREGEQATAENARGVPESMRASYNRIVSGAKLGPGQRKDFVDRAGRLIDAQMRSQTSLEEQYRGIAQREGVDPNQVVVDFVGPLRSRGGPSTDLAGRAESMAQQKFGRPYGQLTKDQRRQVYEAVQRAR